MIEYLNVLLGAAMGLNLVALATSRLPGLIRLVAVQGIILGLLPLLLEKQGTIPLFLLVASTLLVKGVVIPALLRHAMRAAHVDRDMEPIVGFVPSLLLGAAGTVASVVLSRELPLLPEHEDTLLVAASIASVFTGLLLLIIRSKAISQICGYLILENGIYIFGMLLIGSTPLLVEAGILLDLTVAVFVIGVIVDRIQRAFDSIDTGKLTKRPSGFPSAQALTLPFCWR